MACSVDGCDGRVFSRGMCSRHYNRLRTTGTTDNGPRAKLSLAERLWRQVDKRGPDECWPWIAKSLIDGYGVIGRGARTVGKELAHRAAWIVTYGPIPEGEGYHGCVVIHDCDNRLCCNPAHLYLATQADNVADMHAKGRFYTGERPRGSNHGNAKLTEEMVREIRGSADSGAALARRFGVDRSTVTSIRAGKGWRHVVVDNVDKAEGAHAGERHHNAKLTEEMVREIRAAPHGSHALAAYYGISYGTLKDVRSGKNWRTVS